MRAVLFSSEGDRMLEGSTILQVAIVSALLTGMSTSDPLLGFYDNRTKAFQSTGEYLRVLFHSQTAAPGSISFKFRAVKPASSNIPVTVGLLVGGSFGFIFCMAYLGFFIFCLYRKRKGETDLINAPIICDSSDTGGRDNDGCENVFVHADITEERGDNQLRSGLRGSNSRRQHDDARHADWTGHNNAAFQADERNEKEGTLHDDITMLIHATNLKEEPYLPDGNKSCPDPRGAGREDGQLGGQEVNRARGRKTRADWPGEHAARDNRGYHDAGSHGDARDAYSQGQANGREKNPCRMDVEVELNDTEPVIRGGKLILRQSSREGEII